MRDGQARVESDNDLSTQKFTSASGEQDAGSQAMARDRIAASTEQKREGRMAEFEGYCIKCRTKRTVKAGTVVSTSKGRPMAKGACPQCGTTVTRFLSQKEVKK
jgi:hypothetical protein